DIDEVDEEVGRMAYCATISSCSGLLPYGHDTSCASSRRDQLILPTTRRKASFFAQGFPYPTPTAGGFRGCIDSRPHILFHPSVRVRSSFVARSHYRWLP